jgi:hypothetical protein
MIPTNFSFIHAGRVVGRKNARFPRCSPRRCTKRKMGHLNRRTDKAPAINQYQKAEKDLK